MKTIKNYHENSNVLAFKKETYSDGYSKESTYDKNGNPLTYKDSDGRSCEFTYDKNGKPLTFKNSDGFSWEMTYDKNGNRLTYKDSDGLSCESTYDKNGKPLTFKNSKGVFKIKEKVVTKEEFEAFINNQNRPLVGKKVVVDGVEYELK